MDSVERLKKSEKWVHLTLMVILYGYLMLTYPNIVSEERLVYWFVNYDFVVFVGCTYFAASFLVQRYFVKGRYLKFVSFYVLAVLVGTTLILCNDLALLYLYGGPAEEDRGVKLVMFYGSTLGMMIMISSVGVSVRALIHWIVSQHEINAIRREQLQTELAFLRSQMNPHFLFNTINLVFGHIDKTNKTARDIIVKFSELLRYQLYECEVQFIPIEREIQYLEHYVNLQKLRKNDHLSCTLDLSGELRGFEIPPLLMIPLVENAFKYVSFEEGSNNYLGIQLRGDTNEFNFSCINSKSTMKTDDVIKTKGLGLQNVCRRLELLYPNKHTITVEDLEESFEVQFTITR
jgi:two-component system, LytTR family, sensor kinase